VNAWAVLIAPADRDQADPVRADPGRPEHPAGPQAPEWHSLRSPPSCSTYCSTTLPCQIPPSAEQVPSGALGTDHRTVSVTRERVSLRRGMGPRGWPGTPDRHGAAPRGCSWFRRLCRLCPVGVQPHEHRLGLMRVDRPLMHDMPLSVGSTGCLAFSADAGGPGLLPPVGLGLGMKPRWPHVDRRRLTLLPREGRQGP